MDSDDEITRREFLDFCDENNLLTPTTDPAKKKQRVAASGIQHEVHKLLPASDDGSSIVIVQCWILLSICFYFTHVAGRQQDGLCNRSPSRNLFGLGAKKDEEEGSRIRQYNVVCDRGALKTGIYYRISSIWWFQPNVNAFINITTRDKIYLHQCLRYVVLYFTVDGFQRGVLVGYESLLCTVNITDLNVECCSALRTKRALLQCRASAVVVSVSCCLLQAVLYVECCSALRTTCTV